MISLAHVVAPRVGHVTGIGEIHRVLGAHVAAAGRGLLKRNAALMAFRYIEKGAAVRPQQPFVGREDHKVRVETLHVGRQYASAVRRVDKEGRAPLPERRTDLVDIDQPAVRPVHR